MLELIVEDGTLPDGSNTYASLLSISDYLIPRGVEKWKALDVQEQSSIALLTTDFLNGLPWAGFPVKPGRTMAWPQMNQEFVDGTPVPANIIPVQIPRAQCELCAYAVSGQFNPKEPVDRSVGAVVSEKVDVLSITYAAPETNAYNGHTGFPPVDVLLKQFLMGASINKSGGVGMLCVGRG